MVRRSGKSANYNNCCEKVRGAQLYFLNQIKAPGAPGLPGTTWDINKDDVVNAADFSPFYDNPPSSFLLSKGGAGTIKMLQALAMRM